MMNSRTCGVVAAFNRSRYSDRVRWRDLGGGFDGSSTVAPLAGLCPWMVPSLAPCARRALA